MKISELDTESLGRFLSRMPEWCKSGSALSAKLKVKIDGKDKNLRLNKRGAMNYLLPDEITSRLNSLPMMFAGSADKFENGKQRALYPTDIVNYILCSYLLK